MKKTSTHRPEPDPRQRRWRDKRNTVVRQTKHLRNALLEHLIANRDKRGLICAKERRLAVQQLLKSAEPEYDAELISWLRSWVIGLT